METPQRQWWDWDFDLDGKTSETIISVTAIVFIFGLPLLIVFTVFFFNYKNRKAKYRLAEQALSSGQQLPEDFFKNAEKTEDIRTKGIKTSSSASDCSSSSGPYPRTLE